MTVFKKTSILIAALILLSACSVTQKSSDRTAGAMRPSIPEGTTVKLALLETTDIHQNVLSYNYYGLTADPSIGLERTASLIQAARAENPNNVLLDDGDAIQGTLLGDYQAVGAPVPCGATLAVYKVMNALRYDGGGLGNHEFNYGLNFLSRVTNTHFDIPGVEAAQGCGGPVFPLVLSNVSGVASGKPLFSPYSVIEKQFTATTPEGSSISVPIHIGIMSFVPPQIMEWDARSLAGSVRVTGVVESANTFVPQLRRDGADVVVALSHGGLDAAPYSPKMENGSLYLAKTGIDALLIGHTHLIFPQAREPGAPVLDPSLAALPAERVDARHGFVDGVPTVMAQSWGRRLGIITMVLQYHEGRWVVQKDQTMVEARGFKYIDGKTIVAADPGVAPLVQAEHEATIAYATQPLGTTTDVEMSTFFALVGDVAAIEIVNQAQVDYLRRYLAKTTDPNLSNYKTLPVISCSAPFKAGRNGPSDFTDVAPGATPASPFALQVRSPGDLYLYGNNNLQAVKINGDDLKKWLEASAAQFGQIDPEKAGEQDLVPSYASIYNYDIFYAPDNALRYQIDVTRPVGERIANLTYLGRPVTSSDNFVVATNNYRAQGGGNFPGMDGSKTIIQSPDANQAIVAAYIKSQAALATTSNASAQSWNFVPVATKGPVVLRSAPGKMAIARKLGLERVVAEGEIDANGFAHYVIDLRK